MYSADCQAPSCRASGRVHGPKRGSSDPSGYVMEDLLAHAVDNMRIKNVSKTQLARRAEQPKPSLLVSTGRRSLLEQQIPKVASRWRTLEI